MEIVRDMWENPGGPWLARVTVPSLLLPALPTGDSERAARIHQRVADAARSMPHARVHEFADSDHDLHAQHPKELAADLLSLVGDAR
jgi:pimeloyl-ACP methyl ester carboxylesterase